MTEFIGSSMTRRDFLRGIVAGAVVAAIVAISAEELRIAEIKPEATETSTTTSTTTLPTTTTKTTTTTETVGTVTETKTTTTTKTIVVEPPKALTKEITLNVNGEDYEVDVENRTSLLEVLNNKLFLFGAKDGCNQGECGSCAVLVDGEPILSCMALAVELEGKSITTLEGLAPPTGLHPLQQAFLEKDAFQCGFCTGGMILAAKALLDKIPSPTEDDVKYHLAGHICKCSGPYPNIVEAVMAVAGT